MKFVAILYPFILSVCLGSPQTFRRISSNGSPNTRLGLLGPSIGVPPVPGGNFGPTLGGSGASLNSLPPSVGAGPPSGCFCLPANQVCDPKLPLPAGATRLNPNINTRIINLSPTRACPQERKLCCFRGASVGPINPTTAFPIPFPARSSGCGFRNSIVSGRAGSDQADFGEYPWVVAILDRSDKFLAAGALIEPNWVLTAAHKIVEPARNLAVRAGDYDLSVADEVLGFAHQTSQVARVIIHPRYNSSSLLNDVALLQLRNGFRFTESVNSVCLPEKFQKFSGQRCWVSGWGQNNEGNFQAILREVDLPVVDVFECEERLRTTRLGSTFNLDKGSFMCAGGEAGKDACKGDGGAPLVCDEGGFFTVVGLVAWGIGCGQPEVPGVYVNVANFVDFINSYVVRN